ncbi:hypothetical protein ABN028_24245 [Actinopolymorpha sp. B17G11]|uniref:hypothetical protein n=1 Tax=unclassified Actinopolymorpha TaxID=2627063 RepID=UPI0032E481A7
MKSGPDVFCWLREFRAGDAITVTDRAGAKYRFTVVRLERVEQGRAAVRQDSEGDQHVGAAARHLCRHYDRAPHRRMVVVVS